MRDRLGEVASVFLRLGLTSFGGPIAHIGYIRGAVVETRRWVSDAEYAELVALCQFLPGPASSQLVFALGHRRAGPVGAITASLCFTLPSALLMILFALGVANIGGLRESGWIHGLKLAAVPVVAQAVWAMGRSHCPDGTRLLLALCCAAALLAFPSAVGQVAAILVGAVVGWAVFRGMPAAATAPSQEPVRRRRSAHLSLVSLAMLMPLAWALARITSWQGVEVFDSFFRSGTLVFGGGHVILPLLRAEVVPPGWISDDAFMAGYGAAQALPGPLFTFAGYLGALIFTAHPWLGGLWCLLAIFLPACLLIAGALPMWSRVRRVGWMHRAMLGANAAVVGILLAALINPVVREGIGGAADATIAVAGFMLLEVVRAPSWTVVLMVALASQTAM